MKRKKNASTISLVPRETLERQALAMRRRARNQEVDAKKRRRRFMTALVGAGAAFATGFVVGRRIQQGLTTKYSGVDLELVVGGATAVGGILMQGRTGGIAKLGEFFESGGMGILAYYAGSRGEQQGAASIQAAA